MTWRDGLAFLVIVLGLRWLAVGSVSFNNITAFKDETFRWLTILFRTRREPRSAIS